MPSFPDTGRGQSPVIGNILMVAIAIILLSIVAVFALGFAEDIDTTAPSVSLDTTIGDSDVTIRHASGDVLDPTNVEVVVESPNATIRYPLENLRGDASNDFEAGDTFRLSHGVSSGEVDVRVVHEPSNSLVDRSVRTLTDGIISLAVLDEQVANSKYAGSQTSGGSTTIMDGGRTVKLYGNQWRFLNYSYDISSETMITFEFKSTAEGDIHGIGLEKEGTGQDSNRILRLYGTQNWGINISQSSVTSEPYYKQSDDWRRYTIPIGEIYANNDGTFQADSLAFVMDCDPTDNVDSGTDDDRCKSLDADGDPAATSYFRNVEVYEADD
jgi:flagellin-like protein